jgi:hypothetical protein
MTNKNYKAVVTEKGSQQGQTIANTKFGQYKGMSKEQFTAAVKNITCFSFEVIEF